MTRIARWAPLAVVVLLAALPYSALQIPGVFDGPFAQAGTLQLLALCFVFAGLAQSYDLLFGRTGMLSFGHALYFALGAYGTDILVTKANWPLWQAALVALLLGGAVAAALGAVALRVDGVAFAMVTLAFAQVGTIFAGRNPWGLTGGDEGLALQGRGLPAAFVGVANTVNLYWLALAYLVLMVLVVRRIMAAPSGRVLTAIRDDPRRVAVLGLNPWAYKLSVFTAAGMMAAAGGVVYALLIGGASPRVASVDLTLSLLIMVVIGGPATRWGPVIGGVVYTYLDHRLTALGTSDVVGSLPGWLARPLAEPLLVLGVIFILLVYFAPGGLTAVAGRVRHLRTALRESGGNRAAERQVAEPPTVDEQPSTPHPV